MELLRGRAPGRSAEPSAAAESWFLERGLPFVLTRRARWRRLWTRSSPMLAAYAALQACILAVYLITGGHDIEISGEPTTAEWAVLIILALALPLMAVVGWAVSRSRRRKTRTAIATLSVLAVASVGVTVGDLVQQGIVVAAVLILTGSGIGSVLGWAVRMMLSHLATVGALAVRALPVVLLTALVFFNTYVWLMAATIAATGWDWPWRSWSPSLRRSSPRPPESASGRCCNRRRCRATNPKSSRPHRSPRCPA